MLRELEAIQTIADIVSTLTVGERKRVAAWLSAYAEEGAVAAAGAATLAAAAPAPAQMPVSAASMGDASAAGYGAYGEEGEWDDEGWDDAEPEPAADPMESFPALFSAVAPKTNGQKAVVAAYWLERHDGLESWTTHNVNKQLQQLGTKVGSLSIVLSNETKSKSPKVAMLDKQGASMQARKSFVLTQAGIDYVEDRL